MKIQLSIESTLAEDLQYAVRKLHQYAERLRCQWYKRVGYGVEIVSYGDKKIQTIEAVREVTGLGLRETKDLVESAPVMLKNRRRQVVVSTKRNAQEVADFIKDNAKCTVRVRRARKSDIS